MRGVLAIVWLVGIALLVSAGCAYERIPGKLPAHFPLTPEAAPEQDVQFRCVLSVTPYYLADGKLTALPTEERVLYPAMVSFKRELYEALLQCAKATQSHLQRKCASTTYFTLSGNSRPSRYEGEALLFINGEAYSGRGLAVECTGSWQPVEFR
jgi:hypothetical protein